MTFNAWEGRDIKLMIRKDDGIYKANYDGSDEKVHIKFWITSGGGDDEKNSGRFGGEKAGNKSLLL